MSIFKNVLLITNYEQDHQEYMVWSGLHALGINVVDFPYKKSYHGLIDDEYILDDGKRGWTAPSDYALPRKGERYDFERIVDEWDNFDAVIMGNVRTHGRKAASSLRNRLGERWTQPFVIVEGEDYSDIRWDVIKELHPQMYFKREYLKNTPIRYPHDLGYWPPILPCPFSAITDTIPKVNEDEKVYSLFSVHGDTHELRKEVTRRLLDMNIPSSYIWINADFFFKKNNPYANDVVTPTRLNYQEYLEHVAKSRIGVSVRGWGRDTLRRWEIPLFNTLLFTHDIGLEIPNDFKDGETAVFFNSDLSDLEDKVRCYMEDEQLCKKIAKAGKEHLYRYHTAEKRVEYMLDKILGK